LAIKVSHSISRNVYFLFILTGFIEVSCSPTRHIEEGKYLLNKSKINIESKAIDPLEIKRYEKQSPNKKILGVIKFHLFLYNLASPKSVKFPSSWFREIGEEPVVWDSILTNKTTDQFAKFIENKGFYHGKVTDTVLLKRRKANVIYNITLNNPYRINSIGYIFEDQGIAAIVLGDTLNRPIKVGSRFDKDELQKERQRLEDLLKNNGYYKFSKEYIFFEARMSNKKDSIDLTIIIKENISGVIDPSTKYRKHFQYEINNTTFYPNYNLIESNRKSGIISQDTVRYNKYFMIYSGKHNIKPGALIPRNMCIPGNLYRLKDVKKTYDNYITMGLFRVVNIYFREPDDQNTDSSEYKYINCFIELSPRTVQSYQFEVVGTNSSGDLGVRANILYDHYNIFHGAEHFQMKLTGAYEGVSHRLGSVYKYNPMREFGIEPSLALPVFIVPFKAQQFVKKYNPKTLINVSFNYQHQPFYIRNIASTQFGYQWKGNSFNRHSLYPIDFSYVYLQPGSLDSTFKSKIHNTPLENSFTNHAILAARYKFEYSNQDIEKLKDFVYIIYNVESAGILTNTIYQLTHSFNDSIFGVPYFQYLKSDIDIRYNNQINAYNHMVYRIFLGAGYAYGNSDVMPFEKMYYSGGPYGIRAWNTGRLGPGSAAQIDSTGNSLGDYKLEGNLEYRFYLFWKLEGALFLDAGNIWTKEENSLYPGGSFKWDKFYNDIAVGSGYGLRFDFSYLLLRTDFGFKLRDPQIQTGSKWIDANAHYRETLHFIRDRWTFEFGIGYPF
jgi:outer membrane protein assembly factor BamA